MPLPKKYLTCDPLDEQQVTPVRLASFWSEYGGSLDCCSGGSLLLVGCSAGSGLEGVSALFPVCSSPSSPSAADSAGSDDIVTLES